MPLKAIAATLNQVIEDKERVIMYASRTLTENEKKYQIYELECLAVVWAVELFRKYIQNRRTVVRTDCKALQWLKSRQEGTRVLRWVLRLQEYDLDIQYRKSEHSGDVDGMTRNCPQSVDPYGQGLTEPLYDPKFSFPVSRKRKPTKEGSKEEKKAEPQLVEKKTPPAEVEEKKDTEILPIPFQFPEEEVEGIS